MITPQDRFWAKVEFTDTCWLWTASCNNKGYGNFKLAGKTEKAHRVSYEWTKGPIPIGMQIDHLCKVHRCVNPKHLEVVTPGENSRRGDTGLNMRSKTHCPQEHEYNEKNTHKTKQGRRVCRMCHKLRARIYREQKRLNI